MEDTQIIICSRTNSRRIPNKVFHKFDGIPLLERLIERLRPSHIPINIAIPHSQFKDYKYLVSKYTQSFSLFSSVYDEDPLQRMYECAKNAQIKTIVRINHDKIFVDRALIGKALETFRSSNLDYLYSSSFMEGTGFEIISFKALERAAIKYSNVEHVGYAIRAVTKNILDYDVPRKFRGDYRLLIDYPEDLLVLEAVCKSVDNNEGLPEVITWLNKNRHLRAVNQQPLLTIYTCAYNADKYIDECIKSVLNQEDFYKFEYILVDDKSTDNTFPRMGEYANTCKNIRLIRNRENIGLAGSSNIALREAKGKYIIRLDADDYFVGNDALKEMIRYVDGTDSDVIYPANYFGAMDKVQLAHEYHHIGGAIFNTRAINYLKFTDKLRGLEGYDFFRRAESQLKIGYMHRPMFFYRQTDKSMSKTNLDERTKIREDIDEEMASD